MGQYLGQNSMYKRQRDILQVHGGTEAMTFLGIYLGHTQVAGTELDRDQNKDMRKSAAVEQNHTSYLIPRKANCNKSNGEVKTDPCHQGFTTAR
jgi:hypothetical protein